MEDYMVWILLAIIIIIMIVAVIVLSWFGTRIVDPLDNISDSIGKLENDVATIADQLTDLNEEIKRIAKIVEEKLTDGIPTFPVSPPSIIGTITNNNNVVETVSGGGLDLASILNER